MASVAASSRSRRVALARGPTGSWLLQSTDMSTDVGISRLREWARELGFANLGVAHFELQDAAAGLQAWLAAGFQGELDYMERHAGLRAAPDTLLPGVRCAIMVSIDYAPASADWIARAWETLDATERAFVSRYALGRDYHKVVRHRLARLAARIESECGPLIQRPFCDSAPVMEVELARRAGLGWRGKHTLLLNREQGSAFFIGSLYTSLTIDTDDPVRPDGEHCGSCQRCIDVCPTRAIVAPYRLDARRCISYLTIELAGAIPLEFRPAIGNRIYGCDDCQLACPWNKFAQAATLADFQPRHALDRQALADLFAWTADEFSARMAGSAILRIGHERWLRNLAVALGNALREAGNGPAAEVLRQALLARRDDPSALVREHVAWALEQAVA